QQPRRASSVTRFDFMKISQLLLIEFCWCGQLPAADLRLGIIGTDTSHVSGGMIAQMRNYAKNQWNIDDRVITSPVILRKYCISITFLNIRRTFQWLVFVVCRGRGSKSKRGRRRSARSVLGPRERPAGRP